MKLALIVLDSRRGWTEADMQLREWLEYHAIPYRVVATKVDKLKSLKERNQTLRALQGASSMQQSPILFSAVTGQGVKELWQAIFEATSNNKQ